jgi:hypothetical protein
MPEIKIFSLRFSFSSERRCFASEAARPPNLAVRLKNVVPLISCRRQRFLPPALAVGRFHTFRMELREFRTKRFFVEPVFAPLARKYLA